MSESRQSTRREATVRIPGPSSRFTLLRGADGRFASVADDTVELTPDVDDRALWRPRSNGTFESACSDVTIDLRAQDPALEARPGPDARPSDLLREFRARGWVCLPGILERDVVEGLRRVAGVDAEQPPATPFGALSRQAAVAKSVAEPVSLWLLRRYLGTCDIRLAHAPSLAVIDRDDGQRDVQGWHADFPYLWGSTAPGQDAPVPERATGLPLGVQRNVCITDFSKANGATVFRLGSHVLNCAPPHSWGRWTAYLRPGHRAENGLPYTGPECQVIEAPAGSIILYDARTWHRQGLNTSDERRAAMLQAVTPAYVAPFLDTAAEYRAFVAAPFYASLDARVKRELRSLVVHTVVGSTGPRALGVDRTLTGML